ncbi:C40 family peptidase [Cohnella sp. REN36]|uniref:C40 family peptidase n=1 Tax=Cohnella sp. REN36 TaxID=2887347 RepID=UPI001D14CCE6|nr:C40 family peptidase [Cohnella sp. REN36]MCC3375503.1 C40 family peptidase [Cohnella sp. REN36]
MKTRQTLRKIAIGAACFAIFATAGVVAEPRGAHAATSSTVKAAATASQKADKLIAFAKSTQGKVRYKFGVNSPSTMTFDCSSWTKYVFAKQGISLKWGTKAQSKQGTYVAKSNLKKGDLIFFSVSKPGQINHVGIYIGNGQFIHNTTGSKNGVVIGNLNSGNYPKRYITARRVL